jgi:D-proline reductase (dithiol) PrdB
MAGAVLNRVAVQLFRRLPWLGDLWAASRRFVEGATVPWAPLARPLASCRVALVTSAGVHVAGDPPFDMQDPDGDPSFRTIPADVPRERLTITHRYYDHSAADRDVNVVLPIDRLREACAAGRVGAVAPRIYSFMGHVDGRHVRTLVDVTAPEVARRLVADGADAAVLTPA